MTNSRDAQIAVLVEQEAERQAIYLSLPRGQVHPPTLCLQRIWLVDLSSTDRAQRVRMKVQVSYN